MELVSGCVEWCVEIFRRFTAGEPRNEYEKVIFQAIRTILIAAFLKPFKESNAVTT